MWGGMLWNLVTPSRQYMQGFFKEYKEARKGIIGQGDKDLNVSKCYF